MGLLKPAMNQTAFLKVGLQGFQGGGKTFTACDLAIGITKHVKGKKVAFFDTEKGSDFMVKKFQKAGIELLVVKSKAFTDLTAVIDEAIAAGCSALVIDSITHVWREFCSCYLKSKGRRKLFQEDWGVLKEDWASQFTDRFTSSPIHIFLCGRAGHEYDTDTDDDTGKAVSNRTGATKMKAESETGFEPDLCLEMMADVQLLSPKERKGKKRKVGAIINRCLVLKDRSDTINGKTFERPTFENFLPVVKFLNLGGEHAGPDLTRTSQGIFGNVDRSYAERMKQKEIAIEQIQETLVLAGLSGTSKDVQEKRTKALISAFGTSGKLGIDNLDLTQIIDGLAKLRLETGLTPPESKANGAALLAQADAAVTREADVPF